MSKVKAKVNKRSIFGTWHINLVFKLELLVFKHNAFSKLDNHKSNI